MTTFRTRVKRLLAISTCCFTGAQSIIAAGVTIGDRCIISANSLVLDNVESGTAVGGTPAHRIGLIKGEGKTVRVEWDHRVLSNSTAGDRPKNRRRQR